MPRLNRLLALGTALVCTALPGLHAQAQADGNLPVPEDYLPALKGILTAAVSQSPRMIARNAENASAEGGRIVARSGLLPSAGGFFGYYPWQRDFRADLPRYADVTRVNYNFSINQPLFHWGALQNANRIGELQLKMTEGQTAEGYRLLVQEIRAQYLALIIKKSSLAKARLGVQTADENFGVAQTKLEKKVISDADMFMPTLTRDQARLGADRAEQDYENNKLIFARLCGAPVLPDDQIPDAVPDVSIAAPVMAPMLSTYSSQKTPVSYSLQNIGDQIEVEKLNYKNISTRLLPNLNFQIGTSQDQTSYTTNIAAKYRVTSLFTGFMVNWTIFDGFAIRGAKAQSLARRRQLEQSYNDLAANLIDTARNESKLVEFARRDMEMTNRLLTSSVGALRDKKADAARGLASAADVSTAEMYNKDLEIRAYSARSEYLMRVGDFLSTLQQDPALANLPREAMMKKLLIAAAAIVVVGFILAFLLKPVARVAAVQSGRAVNAVPGSVTVQAEYDMPLKSEVGGRIVKSGLDLGEKVTAGTMLAQIDTGDLLLDIEKTQSNYEADKARIAVGSAYQLDLDTARDALDNYERLAKTGQYSLMDLEKQRRIVKQWEQKVALEKVTNKALIDGYENTLKVQHRQLDKMTITAPFDGIVSAVMARPGDLISANFSIATLIATSRTVEAKISQEDFASIKLGQKATVRFLGHDSDIYDATVDKILPTAEADTQRYIIHLAVKCPAEVLVPGLTGEANIIVGERDAKAIIPRRALFGNNVYVVDGGRVRLRKVEQGYVSMNKAEITSGLNSGDLVIVEDLDKYRDGDRVGTTLVK